MEIRTNKFYPGDEDRFHQKLREETRLLIELFQEGKFEDQGDLFGVELEAWLLNPDFSPAHSNVQLLQNLRDPLVSPELSQYNFEMNVIPEKAGPSFLTSLENKLLEVWKRSVTSAEKIGLKACLIGTLPTLQDSMLDPIYLSRLNRYFAMNDRFREMRGGVPIHLRLVGEEEDHLESIHDDLMLEAATTSLQVHIQVRPSEAKRFMNASKIASGPVVAVSSNSPFLFGKNLWAETRIPLFEQGAFLNSFRNSNGEPVGRAGFGEGYCRDSFIEYFLMNLDLYPALLPEVTDTAPKELRHLLLQNGTIWRWNRPIIGVENSGKYHLRIEHRTPSAGPTIKDGVANAAFYIGLVYFLARMEIPPENLLEFEDCRTGFYESARMGLRAEVRWIDGKDYVLQELTEQVLIPAAAQGLKMIGTSSQEIDHYLGDVLLNRVVTRQTGAEFQRKFVRRYGMDSSALMGVYWENMSRNIPVHQWSL